MKLSEYATQRKAFFMKKGLFASYVAGIKDVQVGESYKSIFKFFLPEYVTSLVVFSLPFLLDSYFIGRLHSTSAYATLGVTNNLIHFFIKVAEAFSVGAVVLVGQFNGKEQYKNVGKVIKDSFWITCILGSIISGALFFGAHAIYTWHNVPLEIAYLGVPFLRLRAVGIFFTFIAYAFIGFYKGIKNTKTPMNIYLMGAVVFVLCDYIFIFGNWGAPQMGLNGSALASVLQSLVMLIAAVCFIFGSSAHRKYGISLFSAEKGYLKELLVLIWPMIIDKATLAAAYIWLNKMLCPLGTCAIASFAVVKDMERFAFLPAIASAQIITFLVSNDYGLKNWESIKNNVKKVIFLASVMVFTILLFFSLFPHFVMQLFDRKGEFSPMAAQVFPILSILVFFDLLQLILSGALRGASNVKTVMMVRLMVCLGYFVPVSYVLSNMPISNVALKFMLIYGSFYIGNALMSLVYIHRFRTDDWKS